VSDELRFPTGRFEATGELFDAERQRFIDAIAAAPAELRRAVAGLDDAQLDTPYRPEGWTVRQVVHHLPDSHVNGYTRFRLALTEDEPVIRVYDESRWAELPDARTAPPELSLALLDAVHGRWVALLQSLGPPDFARTFRHPESGLVSLDFGLALYAWHGRHHTAHVTRLRERMAW
jgi:hypothetical protein